MVVVAAKYRIIDNTTINGCHPNSCYFKNKTSWNNTLRIDINNVNSIDKVYLSPGMTEESVAFVYCTCKGKISKEYLEADEDIEAILVSQEEAKELLKGDTKIDIKFYLILQMFINLGDKLFV